MIKKIVALIMITAVFTVTFPWIAVNAEEEFTISCLYSQCVDSDKADSALSTMKGMLCKNTGRMGYIKFDLTSIRDALTGDTELENVTLQLTVLGSKLDGTATSKASKNNIYYVEDDTWGSSLTYNTKPAWSADPISDEYYAEAGLSNAVITFDITGAVKNELLKEGDNTISLALFSNGNGGTYFGSITTSQVERRPILNVKVKEKDKVDAIENVSIQSGSTITGGEVTVALDVTGWTEEPLTPAIFGGLYKVADDGETMLDIKLQNDKQVSLTQSAEVGFTFDVPTDGAQYELRFWVADNVGSSVLRSSEAVIANDIITKKYPQTTRQFNYNTDVCADMDRQTGLITLSGSAVQHNDKTIVKPVCLFVLKDGVAYNQLSTENIKDTAIYAGVLYFDDSNAFEKKFYNPANVARQGYTAYLLSADSVDGERALTLDYYLEGALDAIFGQLITLTDKDAYVQYAMTNSNMLGISNTYATDEVAIYGYLFDMGITDYDTYISKFGQCAAVQGIEATTQQNVLEIIDAHITDFEFEDYIKTGYGSTAYTAAAKNKLAESLKNSTITFDNISDTVAENIILSALTTVVKYGELKSMMTDNKLFGQYFASKLAQDSYYSKISNTADFYKELFSDIASWNSLDYVNSCISEAAKEVYNAQNSVVQTPSSSVRPVVGSGGGGGSSSSVSFAKPAVTQQGKPVQSAQEQPLEVFNDLDSVPWAVESIEKLYSKKIVSGDGTGRFNPLDFATKEEVVKIIVGAFGYDTSDGDISFADVKEGHWARPYIASATQNGIVMGIDEATFGLGINITRQDAVTIIYRVLNQKGISLNKRLSFADGSSISDYAKDAVELLAGVGVVSGMGDNTFCPEHYATRAEICKIVYSAMALMESDR